MNNIKIIYNGKYPCLCQGELIVIVDNIEYIFPDNCLISGGSCFISDDGDEEISEGDWTLDSYPDNFPENLKFEVLEKINECIPKGCCGGCL